MDAKVAAITLLSAVVPVVAIEVRNPLRARFQLRCRVRQSCSEVPPGSPPAMAGSGKGNKLSPRRRNDTLPTLAWSPGLEPGPPERARVGLCEEMVKKW